MRYVLLLLIVSFLSITPITVASKTFDEEPWDIKDAKIVASWPEENIYLYAMDWKREEEHIGIYREIALHVKGFGRYFDCWRVDTNPVWRPTFSLVDIDNDGKKEVIVISTSDTGTGVFIQDVHVFRFDTDKPDKGLNDIYVMDPMIAVYQNVKSKMTKKNGAVTITVNVKGKDYTMTSEESSLGYWGDDVGYGAVRKYKVVDNKLIAEMNVVVGNGVGIAEIVMDYVFENNMLRINNVTFRKYDSVWPKWSD